MKPTILLIALSLGSVAVASAEEDAAPKPASAVPPAMTAAECEVWNRERSFSQAVATHDAAAFAAHLHAGGVFISNSGVLARGRDEFTRSWDGIIKGEGGTLSWYPGRVVIGGDPDTAHSRGPYWIEDADPDAPQRYLKGQFSSVWSKVDGQWLLLFDGGGGGKPEPATAKEIEALKASLPAECPTT
jgi:ketosteroid isomerase-like protein